MGGGRAGATLVAVVAVLLGAVLALPAAAAANTEGIINPPFDPHNPQVDSGWQAGTCSAEPPEPGADLLGRRRPASSSNAPPPTRTGASPSSSSGTTRRSSPCRAETPGRRTERRPGRSPGRPQRQPERHRPVPARDLRSRRPPAPAESQVGESKVEVSLLGVPAPPTPPLTVVPVYNVDAERRRVGAFRARTGRQRSLPRRRRRMGRRLPRGLHDPRAEGRRPRTAARKG